MLSIFLCDEGRLEVGCICLLKYSDNCYLITGSSSGSYAFWWNGGLYLDHSNTFFFAVLFFFDSVFLSSLFSQIFRAGQWLQFFIPTVKALLILKASECENMFGIQARLIPSRILRDGYALSDEVLAAYVGFSSIYAITLQFISI